MKNNKFPVAFSISELADDMWVVVDGVWSHLSFERGTETIDDETVDNLIDVSDDDTPEGEKEYITKE